MSPMYTAGDPANEARPLLSDHDHDHDHQHADGSESLPPSPARIPKSTLLQDENLEEESTTDGYHPLRGLTEAERLAIIDSLPWNRRPSTFWLSPFILTLALMVGIATAAQDQQINSIICKDYLRGKGDPVIGDWDKKVCDGAEVQAFAAIITSHLSSIKNVFADFTSRDKRSLAIGYAMVTLSIGVLVGTVIGKAIYDRTQDNNVVLMVAMVTSICLILYTMALPESRPKEVSTAEANRMPPSPLRSFKEPMSFPSKVRQLLKHTLEPLMFFLPGRIDPTENELPTQYTLLLLIGAYACGQFASNGILAVFIPYTKLVYRWGTSENGTYIIAFGLSTLVVYLVIFPGLQYAYKYFTKTTDSIHLPIKDNNMDIEDVSAMLRDVSTNTGVHIADIAIVPAIEPAHEPVDRAKQDASIKKDLSFFVFGSALFATGKALGGIAILDAILQASAALLYASVFAATARTVPSTVYIVSTGMWVVSIAVTMVNLGGYRRRWAQQAV
ncbi:hypothetical protein BGZ91_001859 [Linnemannia elongata]|nr:hypothetical protein BGZ91_001859 [Linnemannia elongata]